MIQVAPAASPGAPAGDAELPGVASTSEPIVASDSNAVGASGASSRVTADEGEAKAPPTNGEDTGLVKEVTSMFSAGMTRVDRVVGGPANGIGTGKRRRRACRLCSCLCIMITAFLIYLLSGTPLALLPELCTPCILCVLWCVSDRFKRGADRDLRPQQRTRVASAWL